MQTKQWKSVRKNAWNKLIYEHSAYKEKVSDLEHELVNVRAENAVLKAQNKLYADFNSLQFGKGVTSLIKALRVATEALSKSVKKYD
jgi:hypothetical protein